MQDEITALQGRHRLLATGEIVPPIAGGAGISTISADLLHPAPEAGDYVAGSNGYIGHVIRVSNGEATVRGTDIAISEGVPVDVSAAYAAQSDYDTPDRYLASLNANGRYFVADGYSVCVAQLRVVADVSFCRVQQLTDDAKRRAFF